MSASYTVLKTLGRYAPGTVLTVDALAVSAGFDVSRLKDLGVIRDATSGELSSAIALPDPEQSLPSFTTDGTPDGSTYAGRAPTGAILTDISTSPPTTYVNTGTIAAPDWQAAGGGSAGVSSLNGATGDVTLGDGTLTSVSGSGAALQVDVTLPGVASDGLTPGGLVVAGSVVSAALGVALAPDSLDVTGNRLQAGDTNSASYLGETPSGALYIGQDPSIASESALDIVQSAPAPLATAPPQPTLQAIRNFTLISGSGTAPVLLVTDAPSTGADLIQAKADGSTVFRVNPTGGIGAFGVAPPPSQPTMTITTSTITDAAVLAAIHVLIGIVNGSGLAAITEA